MGNIVFWPRICFTIVATAMARQGQGRNKGPPPAHSGQQRIMGRPGGQKQIRCRPGGQEKIRSRPCGQKENNGIADFQWVLKVFL